MDPVRGIIGVPGFLETDAYCDLLASVGTRLDRVVKSNHFSVRLSDHDVASNSAFIRLMSSDIFLYLMLLAWVDWES